MAKVVVVGGGWSGCAAALAAAKAGADVTLLERTDLLLGAGLVAGIMRNNGRYTAAEEMIAMGAGELFHITDQSARHRNLNFPGHEHASIYDVTIIEPMVRLQLEAKGVRVRTEARIVDVVKQGDRIVSVITDGEDEYSGDVFVDTTGTTGPMGNCTKNGNGCAMCILRCPAFGGRVSLTALAGVREMRARRKDGGFGAMSGSCKLDKSSLRADIADTLTQKGVIVIPLPAEQVKPEKLNKKVCQQYALPEFAENLVLIDTGHAKMMTSFFPLDQLRTIPGFEKVHYTDPYGGTRGNSVRFNALAPRDNTMRVIGVQNLFCGGEKAGPFVGCTEAICTGTLGGFNAARFAMGQPLLELPATIAVGDLVQFVNQRIQFGAGLYERYTFSGSVYFNRMKEKGLYSIDNNAIRDRVRAAGMEGVFR
ncbi:MAG: FAD-dependent oxidoreductase [Bacillota bacterium]